MDRWLKPGGGIYVGGNSYTANSAGTYKAVLLDSCGHRDTVDFEVVMNPAPSATLTPATDTVTLCPDSDTLLQVTGDPVQQWTHNGTPLPNASNNLTADQPGTYTAITANSAGCQDTVSIVVEQITPNQYASGILLNQQAMDTLETCELSASLSANDSALVTDHEWQVEGNTISGQPSHTHNFGNTGTYEVTLTTWNQLCPTDPFHDTATVIIHEPATADFSVDTPLCPNQPVPFTNQTTWGGTGAVNYNWEFEPNNTSTQENPTYTFSNAGTYDVQLIATPPYAGCADTVTQDVTIGEIPNITMPSQLETCTGDSITLPVSASQGDYQWIPNTEIDCNTCKVPSVFPTQNREYELTVTTDLGCQASKSTEVTVHDYPTAEAGDDQEICTSGYVVLAGSATPAGQYNYQWSPASSLSHPNNPQTAAYPQDTTTYTLTVSIPGVGCSATDTVTVTPADIDATITTSRDTICPGDTATLSVDPEPDVTYSWSPVSTLTEESGPTTQAFPQNATTYTVTATDTVTGCNSLNIQTITIAPPPTIAVDGPTVVCSGGSAELTATGAKYYEWKPSASLDCNNCDTVTATPTQTTIYTITGTEGHGCGDTVTHEVEVLTEAELTTSNDTTVCPGTEAQLSVTGGTTYDWTPTNDLSCTTCQDPVATPLVTSAYTVTTEVSGGCTDTAEVTVDVHPLPNDPIAAWQHDLCLGDMLELQATGGKSYEWNPKQHIIDANTATPEVYPTDTTTYTLNITYGPHDCPWADSVQVNVIEGEGTLPSDTTICPGDSATLKAEGYQSYEWKSAGDLPCTNCPEIKVGPQNTTDYTLTATVQGGCEIEKTVTVAVDDGPTITIDGPDSLCAGMKDTLTAHPEGVQYKWFPENSIVQATGEIQPESTVTYTVKATEACNAEATHQVVAKDLPTVAAENDTLICLGESAPLSASGAQNYQWSPASAISCTNCPDPIATPTQEMTFTVTGTGANGCKNTDSVKVDVSPNPIVTVPNDTTICKGDEIRLRALDPNDHEWEPASEVDCPTCDTVTVSPQTRTVFTVTAFGPESCTATDSIVVDVQKPEVTASNDTTVCPNENFTLTASGAQSYEWKPGSLTGDTITTSTASSTNYTAIGFDNLGCTDTAHIQVTVHDTINPQITGDTAICPGEAVTWTATEGQNAYWPELDTNAMVLSFSTFQPFHFSTFISDANGCTYERTKQLTLHPTPAISATPDQTIRQYETIQLEATGAATYTWQPSTHLDDSTKQNPIFTAMQEGTFTYTITGYNQYGCRDTATTSITVEPEPQVTVPNAFSPNGDGTNDVFEIKLPEDYQLLKLHIYDRWGNKVYTSEGQPWDGFIDGEPAQVGSYVYRLRYTNDRGEVKERKGNVTVVR